MNIIIFDDFVKDAAGEYQRTLRWLGLRDDVQVDLSIRNIAPPLPNLLIQRFLRCNAVLRTCRTAMHKVVPASAIAAVQRVIGAATQKQRPNAMNPELRVKLQKELRPQVEKLSELIDRDLTYWCREPSTPP